MVQVKLCTNVACVVMRAAHFFESWLASTTGMSLHPALHVKGSKSMLVLIEGTGLGFLGFDHLFAGNIGSFLLKFATAGGCGIWGLVDYVRVMSNAISQSKKGILGFHAWTDGLATPRVLGIVVLVINMLALITLVVIAILKVSRRT